MHLLSAQTMKTWERRLEATFATRAAVAPVMVRRCRRKASPFTCLVIWDVNKYNNATNAPLIGNNCACCDKVAVHLDRVDLAVVPCPQ